MIPLDIVLQGPLYPYTLDIANYYSTGLPFVNCVIVSCWETCPLVEWDNPRVFLLRNQDVEYPGNWNRNRLIKSSFEGISVAPSEYVIKMRTDQIVSLNSMNKLYKYYFEKNYINVKYLNSSNKPYSKIGIMGICSDFPYHPIDHIFWGHKQDLIDLFNIPYDNTWYDEQTTNKSYDELYIRSEVYLGSYYASRFNKEAKKHLKSPDLYLKGKSLNINESLNLSQKIMEKIFLLFPPIQMKWPKAGLMQYHYDVMATERGGHAYWATDEDFRN